MVEFGDGISKEVNRRVHALACALEKNPLPGLGEAVPTYSLRTGLVQRHGGSLQEHSGDELRSAASRNWDRTYTTLY